MSRMNRIVTVVTTAFFTNLAFAEPVANLQKVSWGFYKSFYIDVHGLLW